MKKLLLIALVVSAGLTSCKKDYECECKWADGETIVYDLKDVKKKDAKDACDAAGSLVILGGGSCELK